mmetsp:Transcript_19053/g.62724  ORF Transcript_19053/g.62724 Transcript_19053/m.62724 type:complete len:608 (-) Transcript_19053:889-2712(-)
MSYRKSQIGKLLRLDVGDCDSTSPIRVSASQFLTKLTAPKSVIFIRHGEAEHNSFADWGTRDPVLTENGWSQARGLRHLAILRDALGFNGKDKRAQLVVVSPLRRTLQTAQALMEIMRSIPDFPSVTAIAHPDLQEISSGPCDTGHPAHLLSAQFPEVDFSLLPDDWYDKQRKGNFLSSERILRFLRWVVSRQEVKIICIGHLECFRDMLGIKLGPCGAANFTLSSAGWEQVSLSQSKEEIRSRLSLEQRGRHSFDPRSPFFSPFSRPHSYLSSKSSSTTERSDKEGSLKTNGVNGEGSASEREDYEATAKRVRQVFNKLAGRCRPTAGSGWFRNDFIEGLHSLGLEGISVARLVNEIANDCRSRKSLTELNSITCDDLTSVFIKPHFHKLLSTLELKLGVAAQERLLGARTGASLDRRMEVEDLRPSDGWEGSRLHLSKRLRPHTARNVEEEEEAAEANGGAGHKRKESGKQAQAEKFSRPATAGQTSSADLSRRQTRTRSPQKTNLSSSLSSSMARRALSYQEAKASKYVDETAVLMDKTITELYKSLHIVENKLEKTVMLHHVKSEAAKFHQEEMVRELQTAVADKEAAEKELERLRKSLQEVR